MSNKPANQNAFSAITRGIRVIAQPFYLEEQSVPDRNQYVWAYRIEIINQGDEVVRLETRTWSITDAKGVTQEVHGPGVVGEFPRLAPGETFAYTSGVPLSEPSGMMVGTYQMVSDSGDHFNIDIPAFSLDSPYSTRRLN